MRRKIRRVLSACLMIVMVLLGVWGTEASADGGYGADAYAYMEYLQANYPGRAVRTAVLDAAAGWLKQTVSGMGYEWSGQSFTVDVNGSAISGENIIFSRAGASDRVIVVGAHYDSVGHTNGTDDNATGVGLLLETAKRAAANGNLPYTVRFILFSAEEPGCYGSQYYVDTLSQEERDRILCMINIDTIGAGDFMYLYGGGLDANGQTVRTWAVEQALGAASALGLSMSYHPDVNAQFPVPVKYTASDQQAFDRAGIPYIYLEASNWNGGNYTNFYQTSNPAVADGKMMHVAEYENLPFYTQTFGNRVAEHLSAYALLVDHLLNNLRPAEPAAVPQTETAPETPSAAPETAPVQTEASRTEAAAESEPETTETMTEKKTESTSETASAETTEETGTTQEESESAAEENASGRRPVWPAVAAVSVILIGAAAGIVYWRRKIHR